MSLRRFGCCALLLATLAACGGTSAPGTTTATGQPLTQAQAEIVASVLVKNYDAGGAVFTVALPGASQTSVQFAGQVDYTKGIGQATKRVTGGTGSGETLGLFWTPYEVIEQLPGLSQAMINAGRPGVTYLSRAITKTSGEDILLALLLKTASTQRENPALLQQGSEAGDATFLRTDTLRSIPVDVYHFGKKTSYWVGHDDGVLNRLEANLASAPGTTVIDFLEHKSVTIGGPQFSEVALAAEVPDVVKALTGRAPAPDPRTTVAK